MSQEHVKKTVNVQTLINEQALSGYQKLVLFFCFSILALDGLDTAAVGYIAPLLVAEWGIERSALAPALSAALFGLAFGALAAGPCADRFGRKVTLIVATVFFALFSLLTALAYDISSLALIRFLTGLGLGAAMPNAVTLMAELAPARCRSFVINTVYVGFPLGAAAGGFVAAWLIPHYGWQGIFILGGVLPLLLLPFLIRSLPESVSYMTAHGYPLPRIREVLERICHCDLGHVEKFVLAEAPAKASDSSLRLILSRSYVLSTLMLWVTYFMGLLIFYLLTSWMPLMMKDAGFTIEKAALLTAIFPLGGGIGTLVSGVLMDKFNPGRVLSFVYLLAAGLLIAVGQSMDNVALFAVLIFLAGVMVTGAQASLPALAAPIYPTAARATGMAWMLGIGRFGGISGALLGGVLLAMKLPFSQIVVLLAIPAALAMLALWLLSQKVSRSAAEVASSGALARSNS